MLYSEQKINYIFVVQRDGEQQSTLKKSRRGHLLQQGKSIPKAKKNTKNCVIMDETKLIHLDDQKFRAFPNEGDS